MQKSLKRGYICCLACYLIMGVAFMLPWLYLKQETVNGISVMSIAYNTSDFYTIFSIMLIILSFQVGWYSLLIGKKRILTFSFSIIGMIASLGAVDHGAQEIFRETNHLVSRGVGNYILLGIFCLMFVSVVYKSVKSLINSSDFLHVMKFSKDD